MFKIWCEWDYGQEYCVFTSEEKAYSWLWARIGHVDGHEYYAESMGVHSVDDMKNEGFCGVEPMEVDPLT